MKLNQFVAAAVGAFAHGSAVIAASLDVSADDIDGQIIGDKGPEAGVLIIAETPGATAARPNGTLN